MRLRYFHPKRSIEELKSDYKALALRWHPDRNLDNQKVATEKMQGISEEFEYVMKNRDRLNAGGLGGDGRGVEGLSPEFDLDEFFNDINDLMSRNRVKKYEAAGRMATNLTFMAFKLVKNLTNK